MKCTELVIQDHTVLRRGLDIVDGMLKQLEDGQRIEIADVASVLKFLRFFGDEYHQVMEEEVLFPAVLGAAPDETILRQFVSEHGDERMLLMQIEEALTSRSAMAFLRGARQLTELLRNHCDKEEAILRSFLDSGLSKDQDEAVVAEFMKARTRVEIYANFSRLERKYPPKPIRAEPAPTREIGRARGSGSYV
jgi:hemerythrin-like domain-containing protein